MLVFLVVPSAFYCWKSSSSPCAWGGFKWQHATFSGGCAALILKLHEMVLEIFLMSLHTVFQFFCCPCVFICTACLAPVSDWVCHPRQWFGCVVYSRPYLHLFLFHFHSGWKDHSWHITEHLPIMISSFVSGSCPILGKLFSSYLRPQLTRCQQHPQVVTATDVNWSTVGSHGWIPGIISIEVILRILSQITSVCSIYRWDSEVQV